VKWYSIIMAAAVCLSGCLECDAQTRTYSSTTVIFHTPMPTVSRGVAGGPLGAFTPSGVQTSANGGSGYGQARTVGTELHLMNLAYVTKAKSLPSTLYAEFSVKANAFGTKRGATLRRLIYELPSRMEGTKYVPPSPESIMACLERVENMSRKDLRKFWRNQ
jgi:hypothetical protein